MTLFTVNFKIALLIMPEQCRIILTLFYYDGCSLDEILQALPSYKDKDSLKNRKSKCLKELRKSSSGRRRTKVI